VRVPKTNKQELRLFPLIEYVTFHPLGWQDPAALDANYVRRSDAELFWKDGV
jgi:hypothetical protein